ncbi:MAG: DNA-binding transcriptional regulator HxlR family [Candidatus Methanohalarchaeum thermophilum]|uniref:DNA-binding transcriptional regulator HxlR family n=1 Tax=Methanohalarchaeum thermophilum TaxID=1903181 RepID=A0A1Q6DUJ4_METT1|nr:MAG: DNA-binding transcriptional regulator HxlR family [Candidatus Methanohalarchaeum thermophilum]
MAYRAEMNFKKNKDVKIPSKIEAMLLILEGKDHFKEIIEKSSYSKPTINKILNNLKDEKLIEYKIGEDKRIKRYKLTNKGLKTLKRYNQKLKQQIENPDKKPKPMYNKLPRNKLRSKMIWKQIR